MLYTIKIYSRWYKKKPSKLVNTQNINKIRKKPHSNQMKFSNLKRKIKILHIHYCLERINEIQQLLNQSKMIFQIKTTTKNIDFLIVLHHYNICAELLINHSVGLFSELEVIKSNIQCQIDLNGKKITFKNRWIIFGWKCTWLIFLVHFWILISDLY